MGAVPILPMSRDRGRLAPCRIDEDTGTLEPLDVDDVGNTTMRVLIASHRPMTLTIADVPAVIKSTTFTGQPSPSRTLSGGARPTAIGL